MAEPTRIALERLQVPRIDWQPCGADAPGFQCARVPVPLDYDRPRGAKIVLSVIRARATDPGRRLGSIMINPGGPGGGGVGFLPAIYEYYPERVRARFDIVSFDPRGVEGSATLQCFDTTEQALAVLAPFAFPVTRAEERIWNRGNARFSQGCARRAGAIIDHMSSANVARDMDLMRRAMGDRRMNYIGYSYGSYIGSTYANLFPRRVRAVVIDGVIDPISYATGRGNQAERLPIDARLESEQGAYETLQGFWRLCDEGGPTCSFSDGSPQRRYERLAAALREEPAQLPDGSGGTVPFTYADLVATTLGAMYSPGSWPSLADFLQELDTAGDAAGTRLRELRAQIGWDRAEPYVQTLEGFAGVWCSDGDNPDRVSAWARIARARDLEWPFFGRIWNWGSSICATWPGADDDRYVGPFSRRTANPVLVVNPRYDPATDFGDAVSTLGILGRARLVAVRGWGHTSLGAYSSCANRLIFRYVLTGDPPQRRRTWCAVDSIPFQDEAQTRAVAPEVVGALVPDWLGARRG